jgi:thiol-disulfide isomerase/thioredoxin
MKLQTCGCLGLSLLLTGCGGSTSSSPSSEAAATSASETSSPRTSNDVPLTIVDFDGVQQHIANQRGKVVVMDAWSTSCVPCLKEFHNLVELHHKYSPDQLACMSLSFDYEGLGKPEEQREPVLKFLREQRATFDNLLSSEESDALYRKFHLASVPAVFVYDRSGKLRKRFDNEQAHSKEEAFTYAQVGRLVAELLQEPTDAAPAADHPSSQPSP